LTPPDRRQTVPDVICTDAYELRAALIDFRERQLLAAPLLTDSSAHPTRLAWRSVLQTSLPGRVGWVEFEGVLLVRIELGPSASGPIALTLAGCDDHLLAELRMGEAIFSMDAPDGAVWVVVRGDEPTGRLDFSLHYRLERRLDAEIGRRRRLLGSAFDAIGWREPNLPVPEGPPDKRITFVSRAEGTLDPRSLTPRDLIDDMTATTRTLVVVPDEVESVLRIARLLYVRGWHQWEFFTLGRREALLALEVSLRCLDELERGRASRAPLSELLKRVGTANRGDPLLSDWERGLADSFRQSRNEMTHQTKGPSMDWVSWSRESMEGTIRLINLMWARYRREVPSEIAWEASPAPGP
jgi:hypothetical protein